MRVRHPWSATLFAMAVFVSACTDAGLINPRVAPEFAAPSVRRSLVSAIGVGAQIKTTLSSGYCWDVGGSSRATLARCVDNAGYQLVVPQSNGTLTLGGSCLVPWGETGADGEPLTAYGPGCNSPAGKWTFTSAGEIKSFNGKCLQPRGTGSYGEEIITMPCTGAAAQKWSNSSAVAPPTPVTPTAATVAVTLPATSVTVGGQLQAVADVRDATNSVLTTSTVTWSTSNAGVASVSSTGAVTGVTAGAITVTATADGKTGSVSLQVVAASTSSALVPNALANMRTRQPSGLCWDAGSSSRVTLRTCDSNAGYQLVTLQPNGQMLLGGSCLVSWGDTGADGDPLTVYGSGCGQNTAKWTFTSAEEIRSFNNKCLQPATSGLTGEQVVLMPCSGATIQKWSNVAGSVPSTPPVVAVASVTVTLGASTLVAGSPTQATAVVLDKNSNALTGRLVTWSSATPTIATVSATGAIAAIAAGTTVVSATVEGVTGTAALQVTVPPSSGPSLVTNTLGLMKTRLPSALCWDAGSSSRVSLRACDKTAGYQQVILQANGQMLLGGSCLVSWGDTGADGDPLTAYGPGCGQPTAKWTFTSADEIRGMNNKCLQTQGAGSAGEMILLMPCTGATNQKWSNTAGTGALPVAVATVSASVLPTTISVGTQAQASAIVRDASLNVLSGRVVTWSSSNTAIATVNANGVASGIAAGTVTLTAASEGKTSGALLNVTAAGTPTPGGTHAGYYVSPTAGGGGNGSSQNPWSLATALSQPSNVQAGDTIWLRAGTYRGTFNSKLTGNSGRLIVVRAYPGERASIDGTLNVMGSYAAYWGFEFLNSDVPAYVGGIEVTGPGNKFINLVVHDAAANGFGVFEGAPDTELYGNIVFNNGRGGSQPGRWAHGIYFHNRIGGKQLIDNIVFDNYAFNVHGYTTNGALNNLYLEGNVSFNAGSWAPYDGAEFLIGGQQPVQNLTFINNYSYHGDARDGRNEFGYDNTALSPVGSRLADNILMGVTRIRYFDGITFTGNMLFGSHHETVEVNFAGSQALGPTFNWNNNSYFKGNTNVALFRQLSAPITAWNLSQWQSSFGLDRASTSTDGAPSGNRVIVRANKYELGRGHVVVYNFDKLGSVSANLSSILRVGDKYEIRNVQTYYDAPVVTGVYGGGSVSLPMSAVVAVRPLGAVNAAAPSTSVDFQTFVVIKLP